MEIIKPGEQSPVEYSKQAVEAVVPAASANGHEGLNRARMLWERRHRLLRLTGIGILCVLVAVLIIPKRYESTTRVVPPEQKSLSNMAMMAASMLGGSGGSAVANMGSGLGGLALEMLGSGGNTGLFVGILQSRTVQDHLIDKFDLRKVYWTSSYKEAREKLSGRTDISEDRKTGVLTIKVTDTDPNRAAAIVREYVAELNRLAALLNTSSAHRERVFIEERLKTVKQDLDQAARDLSRFSSQNTMIDLKEQGKAMVEAAATLQGQFIAAQSELQGLSQIYTEQNVRVRSARARVEELRRQLEKMGGTDASLAPGANNSDELYPSIRRLPILGVTYADLYRRTKIQEVVYELLTQQYEISKIQEAKELPTVRVLDPGDVPERHSFPPRLLLIALGTVVSFGMAVLFVSIGAAWKQVPAEDERKLLVGEILVTGKAEMLEAGRRLLPEQNGKGAALWKRLRRGSNGNHPNSSGTPPPE